MKRLFLAVAIVSVLTSNSFAQQRSRDGAVAGGAAGAIIGGIIGHQNDETPEGALIGGVVGAVAGGLMGNARDQQINRERYYQAQLYDQQQQLRQLARPSMRMNDVIAMSQSGVSDNVIVNHIQTSGVERRLEVSEIIQMHQQGVSDHVISAMQRAPLAGTRQVAPVQYRPAFQAPPTIITYEVLPPPRYHYPAPIHYDPHYHY
jgi:outer membrane lipoprotein SlyB